MADIEDIAFRVPVDRVAARVVGKGIHYEREYNYGTTAHSENTLPVRRLTASEIRNGSTNGLSGSKFGRFTVIGIADEPPRKHGAKWVVRCSCGCYEHRTAKAIRNPNNGDDCCKKCRDLIFIKRRYEQLGGA